MARRRLADIVVAVACALGASSLVAACFSFDQMSGGEASDASSSDAPLQSDASGDASGDASQPTDAADAGLCAHSAGSDMVNVADSFCIDGTEVSCGQYSDFLSSSPNLSAQIPECQDNASFVPTDAIWPCAAATLPVAGVTWCDAVAYCKWAGKRLCGAIGGGPTAFADFASASTSEWTAACTHGGTQSYPYGASYQSVCNDLDHDAGAPVPVGSLPGCQGGYPGIFDMSGNLSEWEDSCDGDASLANCRIRSGSWYSNPYDMTCAVPLLAPRMTTDDGVGFRCCAP